MRLRTLLLLAFCVLAATAESLPDDQLVDAEESHVLEYIESPSGEQLAVCKPGHTGPNCQYPICTKSLPINRHSGSAPPGELIVYGFSESCNSNFSLPIDGEIKGDVTVSIVAGMPSIPGAVLLDSNGKEILANTAPDTPDNQFVGIFRNLVPGLYTVRLSSYSDATCFMSVNAITSLTVDGGFVTDMRDDKVQLGIPTAHQGITRYPKEGVSSYLAFVVNGEKYPGMPETVTYLEDGIPVNGTFNVIPRFQCQASSIVSRAYECGNADVYMAMFKGTDQDGSAWQRIYDFSCDAPISLTTTPAPTGPTAPPTPPPTFCDNNGLLLNPGQNNATCYCGAYYTGSRCEYKICFNDGSIDQIGNCVCPIGFQGEHCTEIVCQHKTGMKFDTRHRAFVYVVRASSSMSQLKDQIVRAAMESLAFYESTSAGYFQSFVLVLFNNHKLIFKESYDQASDFMTALNGMNFTQDNMCQDSVFQTLLEVISSTDAMYYPLSPIFVFSDALPDDSDTIRMDLVTQLSQFRGPIFFLMATDPTNGCLTDTADVGYSMLRRVAQYSRGLVTRPKFNDTSMTAVIMAQSIKEADNILTNDFLDTCNNAPKFQSVFVDESSRNVFILASGNSFNATVINPKRTIVNPTTVIRSGDFYLGEFPATVRGNYLVNVATGDSSACQYRILEKNRYEVFFGTAHGLDDDFSAFDPVFNQSSALVAHMNGIRFRDTQNVYTEATIWTNDAMNSDKRVVLYASNGFYRDGCGYNLFYGGWTCPYRDLVFYMTLFVDDREGLTVERTITGMCRANAPVVNPPGGCLNGGVPNTSNNGTCLCAPGFQGDKCQTIVCQNGGSSHTGYCSCPPGYAGTFCEQEACLESNPNAYFGPNYKSFSLFIHDTLFTRSAINAMLDSTPRFLQGLTHRHPEWIVHYQLIRFNDTAYEVLADSDSPYKFADAMAGLRDRNERHIEFSCKDLNILAPLHGALNSTGIKPAGLVFVFVNGLMKSDPVNYENLLEQTALTKISLNFVQMGGNPCGESLSSPGSTMMTGLAAVSGGEYIQAMGMDAGNVLLSIPTLYQSSLIYENYFDDCSTKECAIYFPTDSQTQAFTANIIGDVKGKVKFTSPEPKVSVNPVDLYNSVGVASRMQLMTRACDDGWQQADGGMCVKYIGDPVSWDEAQEFCYRSRSDLAVIFDKKEQDTMDILTAKDYWIGLNDVDTLGTWTWGTHRDRNPLTLNQTGYTQWANGQPVINAAKRCVYRQKSSGWVVEDCKAQKPFICVKASYDYNYFPGAEGTSKLPRGMWKMAVTTYEGPVLVKIRAQSQIRVYLEYTTRLHSDYGSSVLAAGNTTQNHIIAHVTSMQAPSDSASVPTGALQFAQVYTNKNMGMLAAVPFYPRSNCAYDYSSRPFQCPAAALSIVASGVDSHGYEFQRIIPALCYSTDPTHSCENNGFLDPKTQRCICSPNFTGDRCEVPICQKGYLTGGLSCKCFYGFSGRFCQTAMCYKNHENPVVDTPYNKTLVIIFDGTAYGAETNVIQNFAGLMNAIITKATATNGQWFSNFVGIVFRDPKAPQPNSQIISTHNSTQFIQTMQASLAQNAYTSTSTDRQLLEAVIKVLQRKEVAPRSQAFLITSGLPSDSNLANWTMTVMARTHTYINTFILGDQGLPGNKTDDVRAEALYQVTFNSGGGIYQVPDFSGLKNFITADVGTLFDNYYITSRWSRNCSGLYEYLDVSSQSSTLVFDLYAKNAVVSVKDPLGHVYTDKNTTTVVSKTNKFMMLNNNNIPPGIWQVSVDNHVANPGACLVSVRGVNTADTVAVAYTQDIGTDGGLHSDLYSLDPLSQQQNGVLVKSNFGLAKYVQIFSGSDRRLLWASPLVKRINCHYQYISVDLFVCPTDRMVRVAVDGVDDNGHPYRREFTAHCV